MQLAAWIEVILGVSEALNWTRGARRRLNQYQRWTHGSI